MTVNQPYQRLRRKIAYAQRTRQFGREAVPDGAIVFLGDSITAQGSWIEWFGPAVVVQGIGGDTAAGIRRRVHQVGRPSKLFLMAGTNDLGDNRPVAQIVEMIKDIATTVQQQSPGVAIYLQSVTPRSSAMSAEITALNEGLARLATSLGATYIDIFDALSGPDGALRPGFSRDELHLMPPAYEIWREAVRPYVDSPEHGS